MTDSNTHSNDQTPTHTGTAADASTDQTTETGEPLLGAGAPDDGSST